MERRLKTETGHNGVRRLRTFGLLVLPLAAMLYLGGCSKEPVDGPGHASGKVALDFSVEGLGEMLPATKEALTLNTTVRVIAYKSNSSNPATANYVADQAYCWAGTRLLPCIVDADGNITDYAVDQQMKLLPGSYDFYAVSPAIPLNDDKTTLSTAVNNGVDYAVSAKKTVTVPVQATPYGLTLNQLKRQCAQVKLYVYYGNYVNPATLTVNSVKVTGLADAVSGVTVGSDISPATSGTQSLSLAGSDFTVTGNMATQTTPWIVLPRTNATLSLELGLTLDGVEKTVTGAVTTYLGRSSFCRITAKISTESDITISVEEDWAENSGNTPTFEGTYPYVVDGKIIVLWDAFGGSVKWKLHAPWVATPIHRETSSTLNRSGLNTCSRRFEVAKAYAKGSDLESTWVNWYQAVGQRNTSYNPSGFSACADYYQDESRADRGSWRLPTAVEIDAVRWAGLEDDVTGPSINTEYFYWTATERSDDSAYQRKLSDGQSAGTVNKPKSGSARCLCIRDC